MSPVIDADGHVEEPLPELVEAIPSAMRDSAMQLVAEAGPCVSGLAETAAIADHRYRARQDHHHP